jgi:hypothetical protein
MTTQLLSFITYSNWGQMVTVTSRKRFQFACLLARSAALATVAERERSLSHRNQPCLTYIVYYEKINCIGSSNVYHYRLLAANCAEIQPMTFDGQPQL